MSIVIGSQLMSIVVGSQEIAWSVSPAICGSESVMKTLQTWSDNHNVIHSLYMRL